MEPTCRCCSACVPTARSTARLRPAACRSFQPRASAPTRSTVTIDINGSIQVSGESFLSGAVRPFMYFHTRTSAPSAPEAYASQLVEYAFAGHPNSLFFEHVREPDGTLTAVGTSYGAYPNVATMRPLVVQLVGPAAAQPAIEYFHAGFGHYATIVNPVEIGKLDSGEFPGWSRRAGTSNVYPVGTPGTSAVDRFFTTAFPPKSLHVYTANAVESAAVKQNPNWTFERARCSPRSSRLAMAPAPGSRAASRACTTTA